jgi:hypothetical protein
LRGGKFAKWALLLLLWVDLRGGERQHAAPV